MDKNMDEEKLLKIKEIEEKAREINQQLTLIDENIMEMESIKLSLDEIKRDREILVDIGKRIFLPVKITDDRLIIDVGAKSFIKKNIEDTKKTIDKHINVLSEIKKKNIERLRQLEEEINEIAKIYQEKD